MQTIKWVLISYKYTSANILISDESDETKKAIATYCNCIKIYSN